MEHFCIAEINDRLKMSKNINMCITVLNYIDKTLLVLLDVGRTVSLYSFNTAVGALVEISSASLV